MASAWLWHRMTKVVGVTHHAVTVPGQQPVERVQIDVGQQRADHRTLRRPTHRRPSFHAPQDIGLQPAPDRIEKAAIADLRLDPRHQRIVWDRIEVTGQIGIDHVGVARLQPTIDLAQRVMAPASWTEAPGSRRRADLAGVN